MKNEAVRMHPLTDAAASQESLPEFCLIVVPERGPGKYVCAVHRGEKGYSPTTYDHVETVEQAQALVAHVNKRLGVTNLQAECMLIGCMRGWDVPGANPSYMARMLSRTRGPSDLSDKKLVFAEAPWRLSDVRQANSRIASRRSSALDELTPAQRSALVAFKKGQGRDWKAALRDGWLRSAYPGELQQIRNQFGPEWLNKLTQADFDFAKGNGRCYGVLRDCTPESLSFLGTIEGVAVGHADSEHPERLRHVMLTRDALEKVREFPADFIFELVVEESAREEVEIARMSVEGLATEGAWLNWRIHAMGADVPTVDEDAELRARLREVSAEAERRVRGALSLAPENRLHAEIEAPAP